MEVEFNPGLIASNPVSQSAVRRESTPLTDNSMSFERTQVLENTLKEIPQVRPETVAGANALVADANYPPDELLNQVAGILARNINSQA
jgi:hypothetical protein